MKRTEIARIFADMEHYGGQSVTVCGWVRTIRDMKNFGFIELNDGSCFKSLQVVFFETATLENYKEIAKQNVGAALVVRGPWSSPPRPSSPWAEGHRHPGGGTSPLGYPCRKSATGWSSSAPWPPRPPDQPLLRGLPGALGGGLLPSMSSSSTRGFVYVHTPHHHRLRL